jgi:hypothetical protein
MLLIISEKPLNREQIAEHFSEYRMEWDLLESHVRIASIRSQAQFEEKLEESTKTIPMFALINKQEYTTKIQALNEAGDWLLNDARPLWFYKQFLKLAGDCQVIVIKSPDNDEFNKFAGDVVGKGDKIRILDGLEGLKVVENGA